MPVLAASNLRPFTVRAASSNASVVRIPSVLSLEAEKAVMPSIVEIGYVMTFVSKKGASGELAKSRRVSDDLSHPIHSDPVPTEPQQLPGDLLDLSNTETKAHQPSSHGHQAATHPFRQTVPGA